MVKMIIIPVQAKVLNVKFEVPYVLTPTFVKYVAIETQYNQL